MTDLGDMFYQMYRVDLHTLDLIIGEAQRIRAEREYNPQFSLVTSKPESEE